MGCGVVGSSVLKVLKNHQKSIELQTGVSFDVTVISVRDTAKPRSQVVPEQLLISDPMQVAQHSKVDVVLELMGGTDVAHTAVETALRAGKHVVTANKALLAAQGHALFALAESQGVDLYYEASVAGSIPIIRILREALTSDYIEQVQGIVNGTSNYILSRMDTDDLEFADALREAQQAGYAEADPSLDVGGGDAAHKLTLIASLAFAKRFNSNAFAIEGIENVSRADIVFARRFGYVIKPLAVACRSSENPQELFDLRVHPALVPADSMMASIHGALNAVHVKSALMGNGLFSGPGAGGDPTAMSVVSDLIDLGRNIVAGSAGRVAAGGIPQNDISDAQTKDIQHHCSRFYLRFRVRDKPGVLAQIAGALGDHDVSIEQMIQDSSLSQTPEPVYVVVLTHKAREGALHQALKRIADIKDVVEPPCALRIQE